MRYKLVDERRETFVLVFQTNDELAQGIKQFACELKLPSASFKAIGALSSVRLGWLNWETKQYEPSVSLNELLELLSLKSATLPRGAVSLKFMPTLSWANAMARRMAATCCKLIFVRHARSC